MKRAALLLASVSIALGSASLAVAAPEDLLPQGFGDPPPPPVRATPAPRPTTPAPRATQGQASPNPAAVPGPPGAVVQPVPGNVPPPPPLADMGPALDLPADFPTLAELEAMETDEIDQLLGLQPKFDIPPAARRSLEKVGVISMAEGGFPSRALAGQPAQLIRAALSASDGPMVSRWGHILMRRVLASRLDAPEGMDPADFAALRARALNGMGEGVVARALVQDVDGNNYNRLLIDSAFDAYLATGDVLGMCPAARLHGELREDGEWELLQAICIAYRGETRSAERRLDRALGTRLASEIDVRLAQRFAGAAGEGRRAVNIEWEDVDELTPWRLSLARALGVDIPAPLRSGVGPRYDFADLAIPATPLLARVSAADHAAERGVLSSSAMVDLYSQLFASEQYQTADKVDARLLRDAYTAASLTARMEAMRQLWGDQNQYGRFVLTAYAAARMPVDEAMIDDAPELIASMLAAGLDRNALRWGGLVVEGSRSWAMLALVQPSRQSAVAASAVSSFASEDTSEDKRQSGFLLAGLAGLGRLEGDDVSDLSSELGVDLERSSPWSSKIDKAAQLNNSALVALLAGLGMQGTGWDKMTPRQLFHIVRALDQAGLGNEARMIAAEAIARG